MNESMKKPIAIYRAFFFKLSLQPHHYCDCVRYTRYVMISPEFRNVILVSSHFYFTRCKSPDLDQTIVAGQLRVRRKISLFFF